MNKCIREFRADKIQINVWKVEYCFRVRPLNKVAYPGMKISKVTILQPEFAKKIIKKKTKRKLELYLSFLVSMEDDECDDTEAEFVLDDLLKFKETILLKYSKFLSKTELAKLLKEVSFIESKLKVKVYDYDTQLELGRSR